MKRKVWNIKTGEMVVVEGIDATEYIRSGGWTAEQPQPVIVETLPKASKPVDTEEVDMEVVKKARKHK